MMAAWKPTTTPPRTPSGRSRWVEGTGCSPAANATDPLPPCYFGLIQSGKACNVNPWIYFDDILRRIMSHPTHRLRELLPDQWRPLERNSRGLILRS